METFSALLAICAGNSPVTGKFSTQGPVTRSFDVDLRLNKRLSKRWWGYDLKRHRVHYDVIVMTMAPSCSLLQPPGTTYKGKFWVWDFIVNIRCTFHCRATPGTSSSCSTNRGQRYHRTRWLLVCTSWPARIVPASFCPETKQYMLKQYISYDIPQLIVSSKLCMTVIKYI